MLPPYFRDDWELCNFYRNGCVRGLLQPYFRDDSQLCDLYRNVCVRGLLKVGNYLCAMQNPYKM